jgi:hypothetical protein
MAILNATAMERDRVNLGWSVPVQKCQQIVETVAARHRSTLHYCLSRYGIVSQSLQSPADVATTSLALWPCPHSEKRSISATQANAVDSGLGLLGPGSGQRRLAPESDSRLRVFINSASHAGFPNVMNEERRHSRFRAGGKPAFAPAGPCSEPPAAFVRTSPASAGEGHQVEATG